MAKRTKKRSGKKRKANSKFLAAGKAWRAHLNEYRRAHPNMSLKQQMKGAAKTYKKSKKSSSSGGLSLNTSKFKVKVTPKKSKRRKRSKKRKGSKKRRGFSLF
tara:strand:+ start:1378 stop:1686 length:309 start_codon:yes stop_codon:yes gene_type:complete